MEKILHQIWVGPHPMPEREALFSEQIKEHCRATGVAYYLWTDHTLPSLPEVLRERCDYFGRSQDYAFQADVIRVWALQRYGGLYLDIDFELRGGFPSGLWNSAGFFCRHAEDDLTLPNQVFGLSRESSLAEHLISTISSACSWYGPSWLGKTVRQHYGLTEGVPHEGLAARFYVDRIFYMPYRDWEAKCFVHRSLYSWAPENKAKFSRKTVC